MKKTNRQIQIIYGKQGFHLVVNGMWINHTTVDTKAIIEHYNYSQAPYGATEWVSVKAIREFWNAYRLLIVDATRRPYKSVWGNLIPTI